MGWLPAGRMACSDCLGLEADWARLPALLLALPGVSTDLPAPGPEAVSCTSLMPDSLVCSSCRQASRRSRRPSHSCLYCSNQSTTCLSCTPSILQGRCCAWRVLISMPAFSCTLMCFETAGKLILNGAASAFTEASPCIRRASMARRVGSDRAAKVMLRVSVAGLIVLSRKVFFFFCFFFVSYTHLK